MIAILLLILLLLGGCEVLEPAAYYGDGRMPDGDTTLTLLQEVRGGRILPAHGPGFGQTYVLGYAAAVAARGNDVFVMDRASGQLLHINMALGEARALATLSDPDTHGIYVTQDLRIFVVDRFRREVKELTDTGETLRHFSDPSLIPSPIDVAETDWGNTIVIADALSNQLVMFNTLGSAIDVVGPDASRTSIAQRLHALAATRDSIYILDPDMGEVTRFGLRGNPLGYYGEDELLAPSAIAVDRCGRLFVADQSEQGIFVGLPDMRQPPTRVSYGVPVANRITDLWVDADFLYVAAGIDGVKVFRIEPPCPAF